MLARLSPLFIGGPFKTGFQSPNKRFIFDGFPCLVKGG